MTETTQTQPVHLPTGIPGLEEVLFNGIPSESLIAVTGAPGSGKTLFTQQILHFNARPKEKGLVLTTLSESPSKLMKRLPGFDFFQPDKLDQAVLYKDLATACRRKKLKEALPLITAQVEQHEPHFLVLDSFKAMLDITGDPNEERQFIFDLSRELNGLGITVFLVGEYTLQDAERHCLFTIADGVFHFHRRREGLHHRRYVDILKMQGEAYFDGLHPFTLDRTGITVHPRLAASEAPSSFPTPKDKTPSGLPELDLMVDGGLVQGSATLVAGHPGTGKTLMGLHFLFGGIDRSEPALAVTFRDAPFPVSAVADAWGCDPQDMEAQGTLVHWRYPLWEADPHVFANRFKAKLEETEAQRVLIDSLDDLEEAFPDRGQRMNLIHFLVKTCKMKAATSLLVQEVPDLFDTFRLNESGVSCIADNVIVLRYIELSGRIRRAIHILKARDSDHSKEIREVEIVDRRIRIGNGFQALTGLLQGRPVLGETPSHFYLTLRARYVLEAIKQAGTADFAELMRLTGLSRRDLQKQIDELHHRKMVGVLEREGETLYKAVF